jgi:glycosyltransferase involved in cell wall biosynthesis
MRHPTVLSEPAPRANGRTAAGVYARLSCLLPATVVRNASSAVLRRWRASHSEMTIDRASSSRRVATMVAVADGQVAGATARARTASRPRVMLVAKGFPNGNTAGNLTYLDTIVRFLEAEQVDLKLVVLGDRFPDNEFFYRYAEYPGRLDRLAFSQGVRIGKRLALKSVRPVLRNAARRVAMALPARVTSALTSWYFRTNQVSTFDWFTPLSEGDLRFALREIAGFRPDYLFVDTIRLSEIVEATDRSGLTTCVIMHDLATARMRSLGQVAHSLPEHERLALFKLEQRFDDIETEEFRRLALCDDIIAIQRHEADYVAAKLPDKRVIYVPMAARSGGHGRPAARLRRQCLFVGSKGDANVQGMRWYLTHVWPKVRDKLPDAVLDVCGTCCAFLEAPDPSVRLRGRVALLDPFYEDADVCVVPLLAGSGMKIKLVEALSRGCACVTTSIGMQGLEEGAQSAFLHVNTAEAFADAVVLLMTNQAARDDLRMEAAAFMERHLSPEVIFDELRQAIHRP